MPRLIFTPQLQRFIAAPEVFSTACDLRGALDDAFADNPLLRNYILDEQNDLRPNVVIFIDGRRILSHKNWNQAITAESQIHIWQALSGG
ncbi:MoaD/ThiS family protein [Massilia sp. W12]|uniref:MoaD/ThiS family protein n=1 Tax=Massilia sp. W12 TaxID=3126507 RepID=UPI0030CB47E8